MATATFTLNPPTGYTLDGSKLLPSGLSYDGSSYSGSDGTHDVYNINSTGQWTYEEVVIGSVSSPPSEAPTIGTPVVGETTAELPVTYTVGDEDSLEYSLDNGEWTTFTSPINLSELDPSTEYSIAVRARNTDGAGPTASTTFTTDAVEVVDESATATFTLGAPTNHAVVTLETDFSPYIFQGWSQNPTVGDKLVYTTVSNTTITSNADMETDIEGVVDIYHVSQTGVWTYAPIDYSNLPVASNADTTPNGFSVAPLANQNVDEFVEFDPIEVTGVDAETDIPVSVTGTDVEYAVDTGSGYGAFTSTSTSVQLGYFVKPRIRTSTEYQTEAIGSIDIGGVSSSLSATTGVKIALVKRTGKQRAAMETPKSQRRQLPPAPSNIITVEE